MTPSCEAEKEDQRYFNSPPHKKNHIATTMINTVFFKISTHILTKRMTSMGYKKKQVSIFQLTSSRRGWRNSTIFFPIDGNFNSHPHEEDDEQKVGRTVASGIFQLTSSRRGWHQWGTRRSKWVYFNSHPHEEDDYIDEDLRQELNISTHILTKRMTR